MEKIIMNSKNTQKEVGEKIELFKKQNKGIISQMLKEAGVDDVVVLTVEETTTGTDNKKPLIVKTALYDDEKLKKGNVFEEWDINDNKLTAPMLARNIKVKSHDDKTSYGLVVVNHSAMYRGEELNLVFMHELSHLIQKNDKELYANLLDKKVGLSKFRETQAQFMPFVIMFLRAGDKEKFLKEYFENLLPYDSSKSTFNGYNQYKYIKKFIKDYKDDKVPRELGKDDDSINIKSIYNYTKGVVLDGLQAEANAIREKIEEQKGDFLKKLSPKEKENYEDFIESEKGIKENYTESYGKTHTKFSDEYLTRDKIETEDDKNYEEYREKGKERNKHKDKYDELYKEMVNLEKKYGKEFYLMNEMLRKVTSYEYNGEEVNDLFLLDILNSNFYKKEMDKTLFSHTYIYKPDTTYWDLNKKTILNALKGQNKYGDKKKDTKDIEARIKSYEDRIGVLDYFVKEDLPEKMNIDNKESPTELELKNKDYYSELIKKINIFKEKLEGKILDMRKSLTAQPSIDPEKTVSTSNTGELPTIDLLYERTLELELKRLNKIEEELVKIKNWLGKELLKPQNKKAKGNFEKIKSQISTIEDQKSAIRKKKDLFNNTKKEISKLQSNEYISIDEKDRTKNSIIGSLNNKLKLDKSLIKLLLNGDNETKANIEQLKEIQNSIRKGEKESGIDDIVNNILKDKIKEIEEEINNEMYNVDTIEEKIEYKQESLPFSVENRGEEKEKMINNKREINPPQSQELSITASSLYTETLKLELERLDRIKQEVKKLYNKEDMSDKNFLESLSDDKKKIMNDNFNAIKIQENTIKERIDIFKKIRSGVDYYNGKFNLSTKLGLEYSMIDELVKSDKKANIKQLKAIQSSIRKVDSRLKQGYKEQSAAKNVINDMVKNILKDKIVEINEEINKKIGVPSASDKPISQDDNPIDGETLEKSIVKEGEAKKGTAKDKENDASGEEPKEKPELKPEEPKQEPKEELEKPKPQQPQQPEQKPLQESKQPEPTTQQLEQYMPSSSKTLTSDGTGELIQQPELEPKQEQQSPQGELEQKPEEPQQPQQSEQKQEQQPPQKELEQQPKQEPESETKTNAENHAEQDNPSEDEPTINQVGNPDISLEKPNSKSKTEEPTIKNNSEPPIDEP
ncbi:MAG: hypothetical protein LBC92_00145, partial [Rickettsiales bacterium]|nr:hypothetical protein [Rickettsiales bacterium]